MRLHISVALIAALAIGAPVQAQDEISVDTVVATVNGTDITIGHMKVARERLPADYQQLPDELLFKGLLDQLVQQEALRDGSAELSRRAEITLENEARALQVTEIIGKAVEDAITEEAVSEAYLTRFEEADPEEEYNAAHILVETEDAALELVAELEGGADFGTLAREKSTGPSGPNGGDLGWFSAGMMVPEFENAVVALEPGQVSAPVQTQFGWHVIRLNEVRQMDIPSLDDVRAEIVQELEREAVEAILAAAAEAADITRVEEGEIDPAVLSDPTITFQ